MHFLVLSWAGGGPRRKATVGFWAWEAAVVKCNNHPVPDSRTEPADGLNRANPTAGPLRLGWNSQRVLPASTDLCFPGPAMRRDPAHWPHRGPDTVTGGGDKEERADAALKIWCPRSRPVLPRHMRPCLTFLQPRLKSDRKPVRFMLTIYLMEPDLSKTFLFWCITSRTSFHSFCGTKPLESSLCFALGGAGGSGVRQ